MVKGHVKGPVWERQVNKALSLWISHGERADLFRRAVMSGGRFTVAHKTGSTWGLPGDVAAAHPTAFEFLHLFCVEAKHRRDLELTQLIAKRGSFLRQVVTTTAKQANACGLHWMIIAKQNFMPALVIMPATCGYVAVRSASGVLHHHLLDNATLWLCTFDDLLKTDPTEFIRQVKQLGEPSVTSERPPPYLKRRRRVPLVDLGQHRSSTKAGPQRTSAGRPHR